MKRDFRLRSSNYAGQVVDTAGQPLEGAKIEVHLSNDAADKHRNGLFGGLVAVGSSDAARYSSDMDTLFLQHLADVIQRLLPRLQPAQAD